MLRSHIRKGLAMTGFCALPAMAALCHAQVKVASATENAVEPPVLSASGVPAESISSAEPPLPQDDQLGATVAPAAPVPVAEAVAPTPRRFHLSLLLDARLSYDDNIALAPSGAPKLDDFLTRLQGTLIMGLGELEGGGNSLRLTYTPTVYLFANHSSYNSLEHLLRLDGSYRFRRLALSLSQNFQSIESANVERLATTTTTINDASVDVGGRRRLNSYATTANATYDLTGKTSLSGGISYSATDYGASLIDAQNIGATIALDYHYGPKLSIGLAGSAGRNFVDPPTPDQTFEQVNLRTNYEITGKLSANASAGVEFRQFENGTGGHEAPVFNLGLSYLPFDGTAITLSGSSQILNSATLGGQDFSSTQLTFGIRQRLLRRFSLGLNAGYQNLSYFNTVNGARSGREDNYYFVQPSLDVKVTNFWFVGVYYLHRENDSSAGVYSFKENQFGLHTALKF